MLDSKAFDGKPSEFNQLRLVKSFSPRRMPLQYSETCSDPALSVVVVPQEAAGGWLEQGGEYHLLSCFLQRPVCVPFGCLIPWTIPD